jgi:hypothetical protein
MGGRWHARTLVAIACAAIACASLGVTALVSAVPPVVPGRPLQSGQASHALAGVPIVGRMKGESGAQAGPISRGPIFGRTLVPRPTAILLLGLGFAGFYFARTRRRR